MRFVIVALALMAMFSTASEPSSKPAPCKMCEAIFMADGGCSDFENTMKRVHICTHCEKELKAACNPSSKPAPCNMCAAIFMADGGCSDFENTMKRVHICTHCENELKATCDEGAEPEKVVDFTEIKPILTGKISRRYYVIFKCEMPSTFDENKLSKMTLMGSRYGKDIFYKLSSNTQYLSNFGDSGREFTCTVTNNDGKTTAESDPFIPIKSCANHKCKSADLPTLKSYPEEKSCGLFKECSDTKCCDPPKEPENCRFADCGWHGSRKDNARNIICERTGCTKERCCIPPTCESSYHNCDPMDGLKERPHHDKIKCDFEGCTDEKCCWTDEQEQEMYLKKFKEVTVPKCQEWVKCGVPNAINKYSDRRNLVVNGRFAEKNEYPYQVGIANPNGFVGCGGSIISENIVLTAAHCIEEGDKDEVSAYTKIVAGMHHREDTKDTDKTIIFDVEDYVIHRGYDRNIKPRYDNDIALVKIKGSFPCDNKNIQPICIGTLANVGEDLSGLLSLVKGWGRLNYKEAVSITLQEVNFELLDKNACLVRSLYGQEDKPYNGIVYHINDNMICADAHHRDVCQGDSGGPLVVDIDGVDGAHQYTQVGLVSFGPGCNHPDYPSVFIRVMNYEDWLKNLAPNAHYVPIDSSKVIKYKDTDYSKDTRPLCECKEEWSKPKFGDDCFGVEGCGNCNNAEMGNWCVAKDPNCVGIQKKDDGSNDDWFRCVSERCPDCENLSTYFSRCLEIVMEDHCAHHTNEMDLQYCANIKCAKSALGHRQCEEDNCNSGGVSATRNCDKCEKEYQETLRCAQKKIKTDVCQNAEDPHDCARLLCVVENLKFKKCGFEKCPTKSCPACDSKFAAYQQCGIDKTEPKDAPCHGITDMDNGGENQIGGSMDEGEEEDEEANPAWESCYVKNCASEDEVLNQCFKENDCEVDEISIAGKNTEEFTFMEIAKNKLLIFICAFALIGVVYRFGLRSKTQNERLYGELLDEEL